MFDGIVQVQILMTEAGEGMAKKNCASSFPLFEYQLLGDTEIVVVPVVVPENALVLHVAAGVGDGKTKEIPWSWPNLTC